MTESTPKTLDEETGRPPKSRIGSVDSVLARISELRDADKERAQRRASQQGIINGERPFSQAKLEKTGKKNATNFNLREAEGMVDAAKTPYYGLIFRSPRFATIRCRYGDNTQRNHEWSEKLNLRFDEMLRGWQEHDFNVQLKQMQMCVYGVGTVMHHEELPFWDAIKISDVLVPDDTPANIDRLSECVIGPRKMSAVELWKKAEKNDKWKKENVQKAILNASPSTSKWGSDWGEEYEGSLRRGDVLWNGKDSQIKLDHYLVKEFSGKITHCTVLTDGSGEEALLYKEEERYESFREILLPFFFDIGTGEWHSVKGMGPKIHDFCHESNKLTCKMIDGAKRASGLIMQASDANAVTKSQGIEIADGVVFPPDLTVVEHHLQQNFQGIIAVKRDLQGTQQSNTGSYRQRISGENFEPTLGQAQLNYQQQGQLSDASADRYMVTLDQLYREQVRKALKFGKKVSTFKVEEPAPLKQKHNADPLKELVRAFYDGCLEDGVPEEAMKFENIVSVRATRGIGNGSPVSTEIATRGLMEMLPMMDERGRRNAQRARAAVLVGQGNVDLFFPPFDENQLPDDHVALATLENNALRTGGQTIVTPRQDHVIHAQTHMGDAFQHAQQQGNPMQLFAHLNTAGPHIKQHLDAMQIDPTRKDALDALTKQWLMLGKMADKLRQNLEESAKAAEAEQANQPPPVDPAMAKMVMETQGKLAISEKEKMGKLALKAQDQQFRQGLKVDDHHFKKTLSDLETADKMRREQMTNGQ